MQPYIQYKKHKNNNYIVPYNVHTCTCTKGTCTLVMLINPYTVECVYTFVFLFFIELEKCWNERMNALKCKTLVAKMLH